MRVLVIGGTRFVGRLLVFRLLARGHEVTLFNRGTLADPFGTRVERLVGDRTTGDFERRLHDRTFDAVVDFAAYRGDEVQRAIATFSGRVGHYLFVSTGQVYLVRDGLHVGDRGAVETDYDGPVRPLPTDARDVDDWEYGIGKRACEDALIQAFARDRFPATRLRIPMVNGEGDYYRRVQAYIARILDGGPLLVPHRGGDPRTRHVYGIDVASAIEALLGVDGAHGEAFNLANDETPTLVELLTVLSAHLGATPELVPITLARLEAAGIAPADVSPFSGRWMSFLDPAKAKALEFRATPLDVQLGRIVASYLAHVPEAHPGLRHRARELELAASREV
ncbi:MAG: NAD-dependent epimerase/dehydratase family protein [Polyangiales bacterium]